MLRRALAAAMCGALLLASLPSPVPGAGETVPMSIGTLYFPKKNYKVGDWVFYRLTEESRRFGPRVRYQRIQIGGEENYRGEHCVWIETGFGAEEDTLAWSAVLMSESVFDDSLADVHSNFYLRKLHTGKDIEGNPIAMPTRSLDPKKVPDLREYRPKFTEKGTETLHFGGRDLSCRVVETKRNFGRIKDLPDSTQRRFIEETSTRWYAPDDVPITAIVRERSRKVTKVQTWPNGKPSTDYPLLVEEDVTFVLELLSVGHGAKPRLSDRMRSAVTAIPAEEATETFGP